MDRRKFVQNSGAAIGTLLSLPTLLSATSRPSSALKLNSWEAVRSQFKLNHDHIQMAQMLLASHPKPVQEAIDMHRKSFDSNPAMYWEEERVEKEMKVTEQMELKIQKSLRESARYILLQEQTGK